MTNNETDIENSIELRSHDVQEIMSHVPNWMIRWGITLILALLVMGVLITWFIKYPDVISGAAHITTKQDNTKIVSKSSGEIVYLAPEGSFVKKGERIASIKSTLSSDAKDQLLTILIEVENVFSQDSFSYTFQDDAYSFGSIQNEYLELKKSVQDYQFFMTTNSKDFQISNIQTQIKNHTLLRSVSYQQLNTQKPILEQAKERYNSALNLYKSDAISKTELYDQKERLAQTETNISEIKKASLQASITITDLQKQLYNLKQTFLEEKNDFLLTIRGRISSIRNTINEWSDMYEIYASNSGKIAYLQNLSLNKFVESSNELIAIIPKTNDYVGKLVVPSRGYGKIRKGQKIQLTLDNYPSHEYGQLMGAVTSISLMPDANNYRVEFKLSNGMKSTYGKSLKYLPEMSGTAEIITDDMRLTERIFSNFKSLFK